MKSFHSRCVRFFSDISPVSFGNKPIVALIGRPNVGKSTLFNNIVDYDEGRMKIKRLVTPVPGTTRDRAYGICSYLRNDFVVVDTGGLVSKEEADQIGASQEKIRKRRRMEGHGRARYKLPVSVEDIRKQTSIAIREALITLLLVDAVQGPTPSDFEICNFLKDSSLTPGKDFFLVVNKVDNDERKDDCVPPFNSLDCGDPLPISAIHGIGVYDMLETALKGVLDRIPDEGGDKEELEEIDETVPRIALVGQPNVGKSTMLNALIGEQRAIVSSTAGTTHDPVNSEVLWDGKTRISLVDTAGITRQGQHFSGLEKSSILWALRTIERSHVSILLIDPEPGVNSQDQAIASHIMEHQKGAIVAVNKWDHFVHWQEAKEHYLDHVRVQLRFMPWVPVTFASGLTRFGLKNLIDMAIDVFHARAFRLTTGQIQGIIKEATIHHKPPSPSVKGRTKHLKIKYCTQARGYPPTFVFFVNDENLVNFNYRRYLENSIRAVHPYNGTPIKLVFRENKANPRIEKKKQKQKKKQKKKK